MSGEENRGMQRVVKKRGQLIELRRPSTRVGERPTGTGQRQELGSEEAIANRLALFMVNGRRLLTR